MNEGPLSIAVPKGRILKALAPLFSRAGLDVGPLLADDRRLVRDDAAGRLRYVFLKPDDVPTYVEYGAVDLGIAGRDTLLEKKADLYTPLDLGIGRCRLAVAGPRGKPAPDVPRVATKYPRIAADFFAKKGIQAEVIPVSGSVELAPLVGLSDLIVDVVETGKTLEENDLEVIETVAEVSTMLIANRAAYKLRAAEIRPLCEALGKAVAEAASP
ncbi:ATP phosphoribosyltransferase [Polyangium mundeleinium]|uniref:ATP phosphoribosyltransferase n=1 Tax=Polyangium mundeleinium TaxID=2995306 RepID=A0ABT5F3M3_9BACT|nr:ATP phosphoribosyltransferase [Polyangium mundeleinium]MDC0748695.1 ATP phosphoribosyltransferase [Polyangium mundeleinium]